MTKRVLPTIALAALLVPALATARASEKYVGELAGEPGSSIKLSVADTDDGGREITKIAARDFTMSCPDGVIVDQLSAILTGSVQVRSNKTFKVTDDNGDTTFKAKGRIGSRKATGTFRFFGDVSTNQGTVRDCDSGRLSFSAR